MTRDWDIDTGFVIKKSLIKAYVRNINKQELICKLEQLDHTETESFWRLLRQVKWNKRHC